MVQSGGQGSGVIGGLACYSLGMWLSQSIGHWGSWVPTGSGSLGAQQAVCRGWSIECAYLQISVPLSFGRVRECGFLLLPYCEGLWAQFSTASGPRVHSRPCFHLFR